MLKLWLREVVPSKSSNSPMRINCQESDWPCGTEGSQFHPIVDMSKSIIPLNGFKILDN